MRKAVLIFLAVLSAALRFAAAGFPPAVAQTTAETRLSSDMVQGAGEESLPPLHFHDLDTALALAARQGCRVIILAHAPWSDHSRELRRLWDENAEIRRWLAAYVPVILDGENDRQLCRSFGLRAWPSTLILQRDRSVLAELRGWYPPEEYLQRLDELLRRPPKP